MVKQLTDKQKETAIISMGYEIFKVGCNGKVKWLEATQEQRNTAIKQAEIAFEFAKNALLSNPPNDSI